MKALYVHIPFCLHICTYCDFCKVSYYTRRADQYLDALFYEMKDKKIEGNYETIYIGGGTPTCLNYNQLERLFKMLQPLANNVKEYTIEINPETMDEKKIELLRKYGINRLSIGIETFHDELLKEIERYHRVDESLSLIKRLKEDFNDLNIDLMYGLPHQSLREIDEDLQYLDMINPSHVSIYSLILEEGTILNSKGYQPLDDEEDALYFDYINKKMKERGYIHYEVSNYYKDKPSYHNLVYWHDEDYQGIGLGAHSLINHIRYENTKSMTQYLKHDYLDHKEILSENDCLFEKIMMGLRLYEGININEINEMFHIDFINKYEKVINKYIKIGLLELDENLRVSEEGMKFLNTILVDFLDTG